MFRHSPIQPLGKTLIERNLRPNTEYLSFSFDKQHATKAGGPHVLCSHETSCNTTEPMNLPTKMDECEMTPKSCRFPAQSLLPSSHCDKRSAWSFFVVFNMGGVDGWDLQSVRPFISKRPARRSLDLDHCNPTSFRKCCGISMLLPCFPVSML